MNYNQANDQFGNCAQCGQQPSKVLHPCCGDPNSDTCPWDLPKTLGKTHTIEVVADMAAPDCYGNYSNDPLYKGNPTTGVELIAKERHEQFEKHGRTVQDDVQRNTRDQLRRAAKNLLELRPHYSGCPDEWSMELWQKMIVKSYKDRLIIAGALIAAELDRVLQTDKP